MGSSAPFNAYTRNLAASDTGENIPKEPNAGTPKKLTIPLWGGGFTGSWNDTAGRRPPGTRKKSSGPLDYFSALLLALTRDRRPLGRHEMGVRSDRRAERGKKEGRNRQQRRPSF